MQAICDYVAHINICQSEFEQTPSGIPWFEDRALKQYAHGSLRQGLLVSLIHLNIALPLVRNTQTMEFSSQEMDDDASSRFCALDPKTTIDEKSSLAAS